MLKRLRYENGDVDLVDKRIIQALCQDARISLAELSRMLGLSSPTVSERMKRLEENGVIEGYTARINYEALGCPIAAWLRVRPMPGELKRVIKILQDIPEIVQCDRITGEDCFLARAHVKSVGDLEALIDKLIPYSITNTSVIQSTPVNARLADFLSVKD